MLIYLSMPYGTNPDIAAARMALFWGLSAHFLKQGHHIVSPMSMEPAVLKTDMGATWDVWQKYCNDLMDVCGEMWVLMMPGWDQSTGVAEEIARAIRLNKTVRYIDINTGVPTENGTVEFAPVEQEPPRFWAEVLDSEGRQFFEGNTDHFRDTFFDNAYPQVIFEWALQNDFIVKFSREP